MRVSGVGYRVLVPGTLHQSVKAVSFLALARSAATVTVVSSTRVGWDGPAAMLSLYVVRVHALLKVVAAWWAHCHFMYGQPWLLFIYCTAAASLGTGGGVPGVLQGMSRTGTLPAWRATCQAAHAECTGLLFLPVLDALKVASSLLSAFYVPTCV